MSKSEKTSAAAKDESFNRKSIRLRNHDYSEPGYYFITICCHNNECKLGAMKDDHIELSEAGFVIRECWESIPEHFPDVTLHEYIIMPNHLHGLIEIRHVEVQNFEPLRKRNEYQHLIPRSLGSIIRGFKTGVSKSCKENDIHLKLQKNYYDRIIRNTKELPRARKYILHNPIRWLTDDDYRRKNEKSIVYQ